MIATSVGVGTFFLGWLAHKYYEFNPSTKIAYFIPLCVFLWLLCYRYILMPAGQFPFNKARGKLNYWLMTENYEPRKNLKEKADLLKEFYLAQGAVKLFKKTIAAQERGSRVWHITKTITLTDNIISDWGTTYRIHRPTSTFELDIPMVNYQNMSEMCGICGNITTVSIEGDQLFLRTMLNKPIHIITDCHRLNTTITHKELRFLYRLMELFNEVKAELTTSLRMSEELLEKDSTNKDYLALKSTAIFRLAEIAQVQGNFQEAKIGYEKSLAMNKAASNQEGINTITALLQQLKI